MCSGQYLWATGKLVTGSWRPRAHWCAWVAKGSYCSTAWWKIKCWLRRLCQTAPSSTSQVIMSDCFIPCGKNSINNSLKHFSCDGLQRFKWGRHIVFPPASMLKSIHYLCNNPLCTVLSSFSLENQSYLTTFTTQRRWLGAFFPHSGLLTTVWYTDRCCKEFCV